MARRRRRSYESLPTLREFLPTSLTPRLEVGVRTRIALAQLEGLRREALRQIEDRRTFHPAGRLRPARDLNTRRGRVGSLSLLGSQMRFQDPMVNPGSRAFKLFQSLSKPHHDAEYSRKLALCIRRKMRAEVLFAAGKAGRGGIRRSRRRNEFSDVHC